MANSRQSLISLGIKKKKKKVQFKWGSYFRSSNWQRLKWKKNVMINIILPAMRSNDSTFLESNLVICYPKLASTSMTEKFNFQEAITRKWWSNVLKYSYKKVKCSLRYYWSTLKNWTWFKCSILVKQLNKLWDVHIMIWSVVIKILF